MYAQQQAAGCTQQAAGSRCTQQAADVRSRQQAADARISRQQAAGSRCTQQAAVHARLGSRALFSEHRMRSRQSPGPRAQTSQVDLRDVVKAGATASTVHTSAHACAHTRALECLRLRHPRAHAHAHMRAKCACACRCLLCRTSMVDFSPPDSRRPVLAGALPWGWRFFGGGSPSFLPWGW